MSINCNIKKTCTKCGEPKSLDRFDKLKLGKGGLNPRCKECLALYHKARRPLVRDKLKKYKREYDDRNRRRSAKWMRDRRESSEIFRLQETLSSQIRQALREVRDYSTNTRLYRVVGVTYRDLINHLWSTFEINYGVPRSWVDISKVEIDHIIPKFTAKTIEDVHRLNHYTNLQLLLKEDNREKQITDMNHG